MNKYILLVAVTLLYLNQSHAEISNIMPDKNTGPWIVDVHYSNIEQLQTYAKTNKPWSVNKDKKYFTIQIDSISEYKKIIAKGYKVSINQKQMYSAKTIKNAINKSNKSPSALIKSIPGLACYRTVEETFATMDQLVNNYPNLATILDIGDSWNKQDSGGSAGYDMRVLKITNSAIIETKPVLFIISSIHARELAPAELNTRFAEYLLNNYGSNADVTWLVDHREIHLLLQGNPDGRKIAETGELKRKNEDNTFCTNQSSKGVDMNRNFEWQWNQGSGSSNSQCNQTFRGGTNNSTNHVYEPENAAINAHMNAIFADQRGEALLDVAPDNTTGVYIDVHSYSELVLWPYGYDSPGVAPEAPNHNQLQTLGRKFAWYNDYLPEKSNELYGADGASDDNAYGQLGIASYTFELGTAFFQDCNTFENTILPDNLKALIYAAKVAKTPYITASGPDVENLSITNSTDYIFVGDTISVTGIASDQHFSHNLDTTQHPAESEQNITLVEMLVDEAPWDIGATAIALTANDGSFNSNNEAFTGQIDTTGMSLGQHVVYLQSTDASGVIGVAYAKYFTIISASDLGTLSGTIIDITTNQTIEAVTVTYNGLQTTTNAQGQYSFSSLAGSFDISASKQGYATFSLPAIAITASQTTTRDIQLQPIFAILDESSESYSSIADAVTNGWSHASSVGTDDWFVTMTDGVNATRAFAVNDPSAFADKWLVTPEVNLSSQSVLEFWHKFGFEAGTSFYDGGILEIATNANFNNWEDIGSMASVGGYNATLTSGNPRGSGPAWGGSQNSFTRVEINLASYAGTTAKIRWRMLADASVGGTAPWIIDDIKVLDPNITVIDPIFANGFD